MSVAVSLTAAISGMVLLVGALACLLVGQYHEYAVERSLNDAISCDEPAGEDPGVWLFVLSGEQWTGAGRVPPGLPLHDSMRAVASGGRPMEEAVEGNGTVYRVLTKRFGTEVRQVVLDESRQRRTRDGALAAVTVSGLTGLVVAVATGVMVARRALHPVARLLDRRCRFVEDASHELRAPLTRLHMRSQLLLQRADDLPEPLVTELRRMVADSRELGEVLDDMLRGARLRSDAPGDERVDLAEVAADLLGAEAGRLGERELVAVLETRAGPLVVLGVKSALRRMLSALVDNAIGHTPPRGRITVSVAAVDRGRTVELVVEDTGVGFDPAQHRVMFNRFVRGAAGRGHRFGMGLALAREVVESHGGTVVAAGRPGDGARFTVRLPAAPLRSH
ncbi:sensor histidine kinase [Allorhizocola rhizosphaerae]|uniref:sensor histidine kinase n=1 Tax=Allorhizocola rhizosphaerae TaxID=1872709 RepID=UPI0013C3590D|nr:HAMP domain-containing sensor histidine kinase [Allorhizocola rhizosphaerae]